MSSGILPHAAALVRSILDQKPQSDPEATRQALATLHRAAQLCNAAAHLLDAARKAQAALDQTPDPALLTDVAAFLRGEAHP